jgi:hypothetical protein
VPSSNNAVMNIHHGVVVFEGVKTFEELPSRNAGCCGWVDRTVR